jgi:hypothetical protein
MKGVVIFLTLTVAAWSTAKISTAFAAEPYYPYDTYEDYSKKHSPSPPPEASPKPPPPPPKPVVPPAKPRPEEPVAISEPPTFLFPPELDFGVAVGVSYDMFYLSKTFYLLRRGSWYHSRQYDGPWVAMPANKVPPELRKQKLFRIHELRNQEFAVYWKDRAHYKGKVYRPDDEHRLPTQTEEKEKETERGKEKGKDR